MSTEPRKIGRKGEAAIAALLSEPTIDDAAAKAGIGEATLRRWMRRPEFAAAYRKARRAVLERTIGQLQQATGEAAATLRRNLTSGKPSVEVRAAMGILDAAIKGFESLDLADELREIKRLLEGKDAGDDAKAGGTVPGAG